MTTPENVIECTTEIEDNTDKQNEKKKIQKTSKQTPTYQNISQRKKQPQKIENKTKKEQYWVDKLPPEITEKLPKTQHK